MVGYVFCAALCADPLVSSDLIRVLADHRYCFSGTVLDSNQRGGNPTNAPTCCIAAPVSRTPSVVITGLLTLPHPGPAFAVGSTGRMNSRAIPYAVAPNASPYTPTVPHSLTSSHLPTDPEDVCAHPLPRFRYPSFLELLPLQNRLDLLLTPFTAEHQDSRFHDHACLISAEVLYSGVVGPEAR